MEEVARAGRCSDGNIQRGDESLKGVLGNFKQMVAKETNDTERNIVRMSCAIIQKGDAIKMDNNRPISVLNSMCKIFVAIIHNLLADKLDKFLQTMQNGFRKGRGTADAIPCVRRATEHVEQTRTETILVLLDWEKAFDKETRKGLFSASEGMAVDPKIQRVIRALYSNHRLT